VADIPFPLAGPLAERLRAAVDVEGKIIRALESLGPLAGRDVALVDLPPGPLLDRFAAAGIAGLAIPLGETFRLDVPDASLDAVVSLWSGFRGVDQAALAEVDRALRPDGCLLVVHDYGRDDVSALGVPDAPEYRSWSRREGPFLRGGGFKVRVVHCFWTFASVEEARAFLGEAFGERGAAIAETLRRPRLSWNVAIYHRGRRVGRVRGRLLRSPR
jgi:SAM-dependent methyltransferase